MGTNEDHSTYLSRRRFITSSIATGAGLLTTKTFAKQGSPQETSTLEPEALLDTILDIEQPETAVDAVIELFARSGIAVFDDAVTQAYIPPAAPVSPLSFQRWQLAAMVAEMTNGNARPAAEYYDMFPTETDTGEPVPTIGELLAGYYGGAETPGADFTRVYINRMIADNLIITAAELPAPTLLVSLLAGEIMGQFQEAAGLGVLPIGGKVYAARYSQAAMTYAQLPGLSLPGLPDVPAIPNIQLPAMPASSGVCGAAQGFISVVMQRVFSVMKAAEAVRDIPILGGIFGAILDGVKIGLGIITKAVVALLAPVLGIIRSIGAALSVASLLVGTLSPWTVAIAFDPTRTRFGIDAEVMTGKIEVTAGGWDRVEIPPALSECAALIGLELPKPTAADAPVHMTVHQPLPLIVVDNPEIRLDAKALATATYVTQNESAKQAKGDEVIAIAWVQATIERDDLKKLRNDLFNILFSQLPELVSQVVQPIVGPVADELTNKLIALTKVSAQQPLFVTYHSPKQEPEETASAADDSGCFPGTYQLTDPAAIQRAILQMPIDVTGTNIWDFRGDGSIELTYNNMIMTVAIDPAANFTFVFNGTQSGNYSFDGNILTVTITGDNLTVDADMIAIVGDVSNITPMTGTVSGSLTCGDPMVWMIPVEGFGELPYEFISID